MIQPEDVHEETGSSSELFQQRNEVLQLYNIVMLNLIEKLTRIFFACTSIDLSCCVYFQGLCKLGSFEGSDATSRPMADGSTVTLAKACRK